MAAPKSVFHASPTAALQRFRGLFPALRRLTYLNVADRGILAEPTRDAVLAYADHMMYADATRVGHEALLHAAKSRFARLIGADVEEVAFVHNVSDGVNSIIAAFDWLPGDNVVICAELEHPNNLYPWLHLARRGVAVRRVDAVNGIIDAEAMVAAFDARTRMVTAASVTFAPGGRTDLAGIGRAARERGIFFLVDGVQSAGILVHDAEREMFDGFATSTSKGLLGVYGSGFLYCRRDWADRLEPRYLSRTAIDLAPALHSQLGQADYALRPGAGRFEVGSHAFAGAYAAECALGLLLDLGPQVIESHVLDLAREFAEGLRVRGLPVSIAAASPHRSHIVTVGTLGAGGHDVSEDPRLNILSAYLRERDVIQTIRRGQVRFAFHAYNDHDDVARTLDLIDACTRGHALIWDARHHDEPSRHTLSAEAT